MDPYCDRLIVCEECRARQTEIDQAEDDFEEGLFDDGEPDFTIDLDDPAQPGWES